MTSSGIISGVSISHREASLDQLEEAACESNEKLIAALLTRDGIREAFALQTCNRVEAYVVTGDTATGKDALRAQFGDVDPDVRHELDHEASLEHLLRVGGGLESLVLGEDQILGQLRDAYETARTIDALGPLLEEGLTKAIRVGERARTETAINDGVVSLASAAVKLAEEQTELDGATAAVIGAGEMGQLAAKRLAPHVSTLLVRNRTVERANTIAETVGETVTADASGLDALERTFEAADLVISATGSTEPLLTVESLETVGETFIVDITRPRDIPAAAEALDHLTVYDLDRLEAVTEKTRTRRERAAIDVEQIVEEEFERLLDQYKRKRADQVISAMYESAERVKARELEETFSKLDLDEESEAVIESMADTLVSQLLAPPTDSLRDAAADDDWTTIHTALRLFNPNIDADEAENPPPLAAITPEDIPIPEDADADAIPQNVREQLPAAVLEQIEE